MPLIMLRTRCYALSLFFTELYAAFTALAAAAQETLARGNSAHRKEKPV
jgi:hypothetical protein